MLKSRGIRGVLIPPLPAVEDCSSLLDWTQFSIVAATYSAQNLIVNRVVPHHQNNIMLAIARVKAAGYRRLGLVLTSDLMLRANSAYQATLALHQQAGDFPVIPALSLDLTDPDASAAAIKPWLRQFRPDLLLTVENAVPVLKTLLGRSFAEKVGVCLLDHRGSGPFMGIHQHPLIIGETAVDLLAGQVQRGEIGFEKHPRVTMVDGGWV
jgi:LacI family transcriptional regulator